MINIIKLRVTRVKSANTAPNNEIYIKSKSYYTKQNVLRILLFMFDIRVKSKQQI